MRLIEVVIGIGLLGAAGLFALWRIAAGFTRKQCGELRAVVERNQAACLERIGQTGRAVEILELSGQNTSEAIGRALNRSLRSQAMPLLRSGMLPDTVASTLGVAKREVRLLAVVSRVLAR